jgi:hypothetical protein
MHRQNQELIPTLDQTESPNHALATAAATDEGSGTSTGKLTERHVVCWISDTNFQ